MELTIQQGDLAFAVGRALGSVSTKSPLPLLSCVLLEADKGGLRVTGTDLDVTTSVRVPCTVQAAGQASRFRRGTSTTSCARCRAGRSTLALAGGQCEVRYGDGKGWSQLPDPGPRRLPARSRAEGRSHASRSRATRSRA